ncbi:MAG TPA: hypothetical protein VJ933_11160, partial [Phaeodactylibacter sp.]|nr:hypothetical protein [Phaeodactylibacter sp.]
MEGSESVSVTVNETGDAVISGLPYHQSFVVSAENSCGEIAPFYTFYTNETFPEENHVTIHS